MTGEVLCAALASPADPAQTDLAERALDGRLASMAAFLIERGIAADPLFLNAALSAVSVPPESRRQWLVKVLACSLRPELFFWGGLELSDGVRRYAPLMEGAGAGAVECGAPGAFLRAADLAGDVLAKSEISRMGGGRLSIPQGVSAMLSSPLTYLRGAADLRDRYSRKRLVAADTGDPQGPPSVFPGTDADYDAKADEASSGRDPEGISDVLKAGKALLPFRPSANGPDSEIAVLQDFASFLALTDEPLADGDAEACREIAGILDSLPGRMFSFHLAKRYPGCPYAGYAVTIAMLALALLTAGSRFLDSPFCMPFCVSAALSLLDTAFYVPFLFVKAEIGRLADRARWRMAS